MENSRWIRGEAIGKGSFGTVSVGFNRQDGNVFAVKSVSVNSGTAAQIDAIENEISILRSLSSPFVVKYYADDTTVEPKSPAIQYRNLHMEYLPGGTAADLAKSGADEDLIRRYTWCLVSALKYIHSRGVIHCDVKGKNVLLGASPGVAKLADFGSSKVCDDRRAGIVPRGSPLWMAPEVVRGESQDYASDVWAMGCTVIEMITGAPAWRDEGVDTLCRIGYSDELPRFPDRLSDLGIDFLEKCLRKDPVRRWSCDQLLQHPFLCFESTVEIGDLLSPCSVIGWPRLEMMSSDDEENEPDSVSIGSWSAAGERIGKLAGPGGANWESNGWVGVRGVLEDSFVGFRANEEAGTSSGFSESWGAKEGFEWSTQASSLVEESGRLDFPAVETAPSSSVTGELLYLSLLILYHTNYPCYCSNSEDSTNILFFICYALFPIKIGFYNYEKCNKCSIFICYSIFPLAPPPL